MQESAAGDRDHDPDHGRDDAAGDAGCTRAATPENAGAVFKRIHRPVTSEPPFDFLHGLGRYEEKRRELRAERRNDYQEYLEQGRGSGSRETRRQLADPPDQTYPKSFACTPQPDQAAGAGDQVRRPLSDNKSDKRLQHEKYSEELRKQIEEKRRLGEQEKSRLKDEDDRLHIRLEKERGALRREYQNEMASIRLKSRSQPDLRQVAAPAPPPPPSSPRREVRSPSYVFVSKKTTAARPRMTEAARLRFDDKMPQNVATISTQTGDSLMEDLYGDNGFVKTPKPEPHPRVSKLLKNSHQLRITPIKQKLKENQEKMLMRLASAKYNRQS